MLGENFEGHFWDEQIRPERTGIPDGDLNVRITQMFEGVHIIEGLVEDLIEDIGESATTHEFTSRLFDELAFYELLIVVGELGNHVEDKLTLVLVIILEQLQGLKFFLFLEKHSGYLRSDIGQAFLDMVHYDCIQGMREIMHSKPIL